MNKNSPKVWLGVAVTAMVVSGCDCSSSDPCAGATVKFDAPADGMTVDSPIDVTVEMSDKNGAGLKIDSSTLTHKLDGATFDTGTMGTNAGNKATFSGISLEGSCTTPPCTNILHISVSHNPGGDKAACIATKEISVKVNGSANMVPTVACGGFPQDANHDGIINGSELAMGADLKITANTTNTINGGTVTVTEGSSQLATQNPTTPNFDLQIPSASVTDGMHSYTLTASKSGASATATCTINVQRTATTSCGIITPAKATGACGTVTVLGPKADADTSKAGFQLAVSASVNAAAVTTKITVSGGATLDSGALTANNNQVATNFDLPATGTTAYTITETSTDANGNSCTKSVDVSVDYDAPTVTLTSPTQAGSPYTNYNVPFAVTVNDTNSNCGQVVFSTTQGNTTKNFVPVAVAGSSIDSSTTENLFGGAQTVSAVAIDAAGNQGTPTTQLVTVNATAGCSIIFTSSPLDLPNPVIQASNLNGSGQYTAALSATPNCANAAFTVDITPNPSACAAAGQAQSLSGTLDPNGAGSVAFPPDDGCYVIKATVGTNSLAVPFTVVKDAPVIVNPSKQTPYAVLNKGTDADQAAAGYQTALTLMGTIPSGSTVDICTDSTDPALVGATPTPCPGNPGWSVLVGGSGITNTTTSGFTFPDPSTPDVPYNIIAVLVMGSSPLTSAPISILVDTIAPQINSATVVNAVNNILNAAGMGSATHPSISVDVTGPAANVASVIINQTGSSTNDNSVTAYGAVPTVFVLDALTTPLEATFNWTVTVRDTAGNSSTLSIPATLVDTVLPTCSISSPSSNALFNISQDADSNSANGWQLSSQVTTSADAATVTVTTSPASTTATNALSSNAWTAQLTVPTTTGMVGTFTVNAHCVDEAGNPADATAVTGVTVDLDAPTCAFTAPVTGTSTSSFVNPTTLNVTGAEGRQVSISVTNTNGTTTLTPLTVSSGVATGSESYPAGVDTVNASVSDAAGNVGTCSVANYTVSGTGCDISVTAPLPNAAGHTFAKTSPFNVIAHTSCGAGKNVTVTDIGNSQVFGPAATVAGGGGSDATIAVTKADGIYTFKVEIDDGTGIKTSVNVTIAVDTQAPNATGVTPTGANLFFVAAGNVNLPNAAYIVDKAPGTPADFDVVLTNLTGADLGFVDILVGGATVQSTAVSGNSLATLTIPSSLVQKTSGQFQIQLRDEAGNTRIISTSTIQVDVVPPAPIVLTQAIANSRTATANLSWPVVYDDGSSSSSGAASYDVRWSTSIMGGTTCAQYFDTNKFNKNGDVSPNSLALTPLPPMNTYNIIVRAHDAIGNYSTCTNPTPLANPGTQDVLTNPSGTPSQLFGVATAANGSLDGDAIDDLVVSAAAADSVYVYFGNASFGTSAACNATTHCQTITGTAGDYFGSDVAVGNVGDTTAPDLIVSAPLFNAGQGRVMIYFGGANPLVTTSPIEIDGDPADQNYGFGISVKVIPSIDSDAIGELVIASPFAANGQGMVYIFKGRTKAQWQALGATVPLTAADWKIIGPNPANGGNNFFGGLGSFSIGGVGDITGDGKPEFIVSAPKDNVNRVYQFSGAAVAASSATITTGDGATADQSLKQLTNGPTLIGNFPNGFGVAIKGGINIVNGAGPDLVVGCASGQEVFIYSDAATTGWAGAPYSTITGGNAFGSVLSAGDFDGDGTPDLLIADQSTPSNVWLFLHRGSTNDFDTVAGNGYRQSVMAGNTIGLSVAVGDFDGNGKVDFAAGDDGNSPGKVTVWHP
ncbi:MAG: VCBS repeat-containing protein [Myxococcaceae bacterium]